jgi:aminoglycoside phosphotransferase (APT) family kinase protein
MFELTADNAADYLRRQGWIGPGPARVEALGGGVSNAVLRVEADGRLFVLKQSRPQLRTRDDWFSDLDRVYREQEVMAVLRPLLPPLVVPEVLHSDRADYVFAMSHAPRSAQNWKAQLLAGQVDLAVGEQAGRVLGRLHERTAAEPALVERFADRTVFVQLRVDPFYRRVQERRPEVAEAVVPLIEGLLTAREALCHGDYSPKNILTHAAGFTLVDYETAHFGDPAMDLGFFLSHLLLKACKRHPERERYFELTRAFWRGYAAEVHYRPVTELVGRGIGHLGVYLLARIDGTSPVDYLPEEEKREAVRRLGRWLLWERPAAWEEVLRRWAGELAFVCEIR